jgi:hypothetical protein
VAVLALVLGLVLLVLPLVLLLALLELPALTPLRSFWGFFNEGFTDDEKSCPAYEAMAKAFKGRLRRGPSAIVPLQSPSY